MPHVIDAAKLQALIDELAVIRSEMCDLSALIRTLNDRHARLETRAYEIRIEARRLTFGEPKEALS